LAGGASSGGAISAADSSIGASSNVARSTSSAPRTAEANNSNTSDNAVSRDIPHQEMARPLDPWIRLRCIVHPVRRAAARKSVQAFWKSGGNYTKSPLRRPSEFAGRSRASSPAHALQNRTELRLFARVAPATHKNFTAAGTCVPTRVAENTEEESKTQSMRAAALQRTPAFFSPSNCISLRSLRLRGAILFVQCRKNRGANISRSVLA
jgi:hypothetical protein